MTRGYFGIGVANAKSEVNVGTLWRSAFSFGADFIFTVGRRYRPQASDTMRASWHIPLFNYADVDDLIAHLPNGCPLVGVECGVEAVPLNTFRHPYRAAYMLGAEDNGLSRAQMDACHKLVVIPGASMCLNVAAAGTVLLYERARFLNRLTEVA